MIITALKSYFACAWSAWTYIPPWGKMPADKPSYWKNYLGFNDPSPDLRAAWAAYEAEPGFHLLKDILVEWVKVWPQRAGKVMALGGCLFALAAFLTGLGMGGLLIWAL